MRCDAMRECRSEDQRQREVVMPSEVVCAGGDLFEKMGLGFEGKGRPQAKLWEESGNLYG